MKTFIFPSERKIFLFNDSLLISCKYFQEQSQSKFAKQVFFYDFKLANLFLNSLEDWQGELAKDFLTFCDLPNFEGKSLLSFLEKPFATFKNLPNVSKDLQDEIESIIEEQIENACFNFWVGLYSNHCLVFKNENESSFSYNENESLFEIPTNPTLPCFA